MSDLDWLARIETRRREWGGGFFLADAEVDFVLAAARAHLEEKSKCHQDLDAQNVGKFHASARREWRIPMGLSLLSLEEIDRLFPPQPPQREDDDGLRRDSTDGSDLAGGPVDRIGGVSAVEHASVAQSEDAGLVERLEWLITGAHSKSVVEQAIAALEAKDAEKAQSIAMINELATMCNELKATIEAKDAEIERWTVRAFERDKFWNELVEAQTEIERLKEIIGGQQEQMSEIERLREALEEILKSLPHGRVGAIARAALKGGKGSE
jgi:5'-3' exonuclease